MSVFLKQKFLQSNYFHLWFPTIFESRGGIQCYLKDLLLALEEIHNLRLTIFNKLDKAKPKGEFQSKQISFLFSGNIPNFLLLPHFALSLLVGAFIKRPNLILCGHINFSPVAFWIYRFTGIPYWIIVYGIDAWDIKDHWRKKALHNAEKVISISVYTGTRLIHKQNLNPQKVSILPVTFDASRFQIKQKPQHLLNRYGLTAEQPIILTVARLDSRERYKGYDKILQSLPEICCQTPNVHYFIVGKGSDIPRIEQLIAQLNLQECVTLTGFVSDEELGDYYNICDVFAMPSKSEGFGIVYLEALACGKPTLAGNQDGAMDALCQGELGALIDPDDIGTIAKTFIQILQGTYPHPIMYQPEVLRQKVIDIYGFDQFKNTLFKYLEEFSVTQPKKAKP